MAFYVYIIKSKKDESFYIGYTQNLINRLKEHNEGSSRYTSGKRPWVIVYSEELCSKREALKRERFLKKQRNREFYKRLVDKANQ